MFLTGWSNGLFLRSFTNKMPCLKHRGWIGIFIFCLSIKSYNTADTEENPFDKRTFTDKLRKDLLKNYNKLSRPNQHFNSTIVELGLTVRHVEVLEATSTVNFYTFARLVWTDERLKWDPDDFGGLKMLRFTPSEIWKPDMVVHNSAISGSIMWSGVFLMVHADGKVLYVPPGRQSVLCDLNLKYWPYDVQKCSIIIASWTSKGDEIDIKPYSSSPGAYLSLMVLENGQWEIIESSVERKAYQYELADKNQEYPSLTFTITLARKARAYGFVVVTPLIYILVSTLVTFWLIPHGYGRIYINFGTLLIIFSLFTYFNRKLSFLGDHIPAVMSFYSHCLYIVSLAMVESMIIKWITDTSHTYPVPWRIKKYFTGRLGAITGFTPKMHQVTGDEEETESGHQTPNSSGYLGQKFDDSETLIFKKEWISFAIAIDRLAFSFYCFLFSIMIIVHFS